MVGTVGGRGPITGCAPTNADCVAMPKGTVETLLNPEKKGKLAGILTYHVVAGKVMAADVVKLKEAVTVQGQTVAVNASDAGVKIGKANVVKTDIVCTNGVIHVLDAVLLPPAK